MILVQLSIPLLTVERCLRIESRLEGESREKGRITPRKFARSLQWLAASSIGRPLTLTLRRELGDECMVSNSICKCGKQNHFECGGIRAWRRVAAAVSVVRAAGVSTIRCNFLFERRRTNGRHADHLSDGTLVVVNAFWSMLPMVPSFSPAAASKESLSPFCSSHGTVESRFEL